MSAMITNFRPRQTAAPISFTAASELMLEWTAEYDRQRQMADSDDYAAIYKTAWRVREREGRDLESGWLNDGRERSAHLEPRGLSLAAAMALPSLPSGDRPVRRRQVYARDLTAAEIVIAAVEEAIGDAQDVTIVRQLAAGRRQRAVAAELGIGKTTLVDRRDRAWRRVRAALSSQPERMAA